MSRAQRLRPVLELLASMRFAISLLTLICIASVIGTVLKQNEPLTAYINQFGPFWAEVFVQLRLNTVYSAPWFLLILAFLVTSTSLCIARNAPKIFADLRDYKEHLREQALAAFHHRAQWHSPTPPELSAQQLGQRLVQAGWRVKLQARERGYMVAAKAGAVNKLGYLAAHSAVVLVCVGGLLDSDLLVRAQMLWQGKSPVSGNGAIADVPAQHRLDPRNPVFRANMLVPEGARSGTAVLTLGQGVVLQDLGFSIELKKFVVEYYSTGMPKLFASDIAIHDATTGQATAARVEVNHPVRYQGIDIFQSSFEDGGSRLYFKAIPLNGGAAFDVQGTVGASASLKHEASNTALTLEFTGLRVINVENLQNASAQTSTDPRKVDLLPGALAALDARLGAANKTKTKTKKELRNVGPSVTYKLRDNAGQAREFHSFMLPVDLGEAVPQFLFGVREALSEPFRYLRIPADESLGLDGFLQLNAALADPDLRARAARIYAARVTDPKRPELAAQLSASAERALEIFAGEAPPSANPPAAPNATTNPDPNKPGAPSPGQPQGGLAAIAQYLEEKVPAAERERAGEVLVRVLSGALFDLAQLARQRAGAAPLPASERTEAFMTQAVFALSDVRAYPAPLLLSLSDFSHVQASVFQLTRAPGRYLVYLGCLLLILGIFAMLYIRERRVWLWLAPATGDNAPGSVVTLALSSNRRTLDTEREFVQLKTLLEAPTA